MKPMPTRRGILRVAALAPAWVLLRRHTATAQNPLLAGTPECPDRDEPTPSETAGPFFKPQSPERNSLLEPGETAAQIRLTGQVLTPDCRPLASALLDFWHANPRGIYDLKGFRYRGHLFTDANGRFELITNIPGLYPARTRHIHVRVQPRGGPLLTTQLYFPNEPRNAQDGLFMPALLMRTMEAAGGVDANFNFVIGA